MTDADGVDDWANDQSGAASLGNARLTQRLVTLARQWSQSPQCSFPQSLDGPELKAAYRFFDKRKVDPDSVQTSVTSCMMVSSPELTSRA
jgi:hypothetical protein